jgi:hypothetical protein
MRKKHRRCYTRTKYKKIEYLPPYNTLPIGRRRWNLSQYKLELGCCRCGYNKCARALQFHHIDKANKSADISNMIRYACTREILEKELAKCCLVCANCHCEIEEAYDNT